MLLFKFTKNSKFLQIFILSAKKQQKTQLPQNIKRKQAQTVIRNQKIISQHFQPVRQSHMPKAPEKPLTANIFHNSNII